MKVALLCGGVGRRMAPLIKNKTLLKFAGKPLIVHQADTIMRVGIDQLVIIGNHDNIADIKSAVAGLRGINVDFAIQEKPCGMADALLSASNFLMAWPFILASSDDIVETSAYARLIDEYEKTEHYFSYLTAYPTRSYFPGGYLVVDRDGEIRHILEKPPKGEEPSNLINIVIHLHGHPRELMDYMVRISSTTDDVYEKALDQIIHDGHHIKAVLYDGAWQPIKYPWHVLDAMDYFLNRLKRQISLSAQISEKAVIDGNVVIADNVRVLEGAIIRGPTYIGRNSIVGNGALVRNSNIGDECVIGYNTEIKHSYIGDRCWFHSNYIGDSVIEDDCAFGAGAITANFRFDETTIKVKVDDKEVDTGHDKLGAMVGRGSRIGINASLMPGIRVGAHSLVGPHVCLTSDLQAGKMALAESRYQVLPGETKSVGDKRQELFRRLSD